jgi:hypothetical protein
MLFRHLTTRVAGLAILVLGIWGGIIAFVGPYFSFTLGPDHTWTWTMGRLWLDVLPAIAAVFGGLTLLAGGPRISGRFGALMALLAGAWFAIGPSLSEIWHIGGAQGIGHGTATVQGLEMLSMHTGLGVVVAALAAYALPGYVAALPARAATTAAGATAADAPLAAPRARSGLLTRRGDRTGPGRTYPTH